MEETYFNFTFEQLLNAVECVFDKDEYDIRIKDRSKNGYKQIILTLGNKDIDITCYNNYGSSNIYEIGLLNDSVSLHSDMFGNMTAQQIAFLFSELVDNIED